MDALDTFRRLLLFILLCLSLHSLVSLLFRIRSPLFTSSLPICQHNFKCLFRFTSLIFFNIFIIFFLQCRCFIDKWFLLLITQQFPFFANFLCNIRNLHIGKLFLHRSAYVLCVQKVIRQWTLWTLFVLWFLRKTHL